MPRLTTKWEIIPAKRMQRISTSEKGKENRVWHINPMSTLTNSVGFQQSLRLSVAPLKPTQASTMVESPQFGAQKATGSSYRAHNQRQRVGTNTPDSQSEQACDLGHEICQQSPDSGTFPGYLARTGFYKPGYCFF